MYNCANCNRIYDLTNEEHDIVSTGQLVRLKCKCDQQYGLDIIIGADQDYDENNKPIFNMWSMDFTDPRVTNQKWKIKKTILKEPENV